MDQRCAEPLKVIIFCHFYYFIHAEYNLLGSKIFSANVTNNATKIATTTTIIIADSSLSIFFNNNINASLILFTGRSKVALRCPKLTLKLNILKEKAALNTPNVAQTKVRLQHFSDTIKT